jgi:hypothetical protein
MYNIMRVFAAVLVEHYFVDGLLHPVDIYNTIVANLEKLGFFFKRQNAAPAYLFWG